MKRSSSNVGCLIAAVAFGLSVGSACRAGPFGVLRARNKEAEAVSTPGVSTQSYNGRDILVYAPRHLPTQGARGLVVVLHGGMGNASRIATGTSEKGLNMNAAADTHGFIVAYLNGTAVTRRLGADKLGWNAGGGCCGMAAENDVDDIGYITGAVRELTEKYKVDPSHVYGMGHSNGAMMTQRLMCETTIFRAAVVVAGPLNTKVQRCPGASGTQILAIHGADDKNVPVAGGAGTTGLSRAVYNSEAYSKEVFTLSGADYRLQIVDRADHKIDSIANAILQTEGISLAEKAARFFGLAD